MKKFTPPRDYADARKLLGKSLYGLSLIRGLTQEITRLRAITSPGEAAAFEQARVRTKREEVWEQEQSPDTDLVSNSVAIELLKQMAASLKYLEDNTPRELFG